LGESPPTGFGIVVEGGPTLLGLDVVAFDVGAEAVEI
jgi:hypothetical protein